MIARDFSMDTLFRAQARANAGHEATVDGSQRLTYAALDQRVDALAGWMLARGICPGDRVALALTDGAPFLTVLLACGRIGAIAVLLNWRLAPGEVAWIMSDADVSLTFVSPRFRDLLAESRAGELFEVDERHDTAGAFETAVGRKHEGSALDLPPERPLYMMYTSGTTGRPKGCLQSGSALASAALGFCVRRGFNHRQRLLSTNPLFHVVGMQQAAAMIACGGTTVFAGRDDDPLAVLDLLHREGCTTTSVFPQIMRPWLVAPDGPMRDGQMSLTNYTGGAGIGNPLAYEFIERDWDCRVVGGYGQTEICGFCTALDYSDMLEAPSSIGWPMPHLEMSIRDPSGQALPPGAEGEICMRGPSVMLGYWRNQEATDAALGHGWLRSGDLGRMDERGLFYMLGRAKELIKTGGENVYPAEVDAVFADMREVADAGCCGVPDRQWGEAVKAFVVLKPGLTLSRAEIDARFKSRIAGYKRPRYIEFVDRLPRDSLGKLLRRELSKRPVTPEQAV